MSRSSLKHSTCRSLKWGWDLKPEMSRSSLKHSTCRFGIMINAERDGEHKGCNYGSIERELGWNDCAYCQNYVEKRERMK